MCGCVLRAGGENFDVDGFLADSPFVPSRIFRRSDERSSVGRAVSGFNLTVSDAAGDQLKEQIDDALRFLRANRHELRRLTGRADVDPVEIDFGCDFPYGKTLGRNHRLPIALIRECADLGIEVNISVYATFADEDEKAE